MFIDLSGIFRKLEKFSGEKENMIKNGVVVIELLL